MNRVKSVHSSGTATSNSYSLVAVAFISCSPAGGSSGKGLPANDDTKKCKTKAALSFTEGSLIGPSHPAAGGIVVRVPKVGGSPKTWCTGMLVCNRAVLTAAHCFTSMKAPGAKAWFISDMNVRDVMKKASDEQSSKFPNDPSQFFPCAHANGFCSEIKSYSSHPRWPVDNKTGHPDDIAVVELAEASPLRNFPKLSAEKPVKDKIYMGIGWGNRSPELGTDYGRENFLAQRLYQEQADGIVDFKDMDYVEGVLWDEGKGALPGDSGGPLLGDSALQGKTSSALYVAAGFKWVDPKIYAVASAGYGRFLGFYRQRYVPVSRHATFIKKHLARYCDKEEECHVDDTDPKPTPSGENPPRGPESGKTYVGSCISGYKSVPVYRGDFKRSCTEYHYLPGQSTFTLEEELENERYRCFAYSEMVEGYDQPAQWSDAKCPTTVGGYPRSGVTDSNENGTYFYIEYKKAGTD